MGMIRVMVSALLAMLLMAGPAEARRVRFFGFGGGGGGGGTAAETIERVKDLPDRAPYLRDGVSWDVGYLNSMTRKSGYVLYHGDTFVTLDKEMIEVLKEDLGSDPTAAHRTAAEAARKAAISTTDNVVERRPGESREEFAERAQRELADKNAGASSAAEAKRARGGAAGSMLLVGGLGIFAVFKMARSAFKPSARAEVAEEAEPTPADTSSFDERVARRLAEMHGGAAAPATAAAAPAGVRTFGRRAG